MTNMELNSLTLVRLTPEELLRDCPTQSNLHDPVEISGTQEKIRSSSHLRYLLAYVMSARELSLPLHLHGALGHVGTEVAMGTYG